MPDKIIGEEKKMGPVRIYYESDEPEHESEVYISISNKSHKEKDGKRWCLSPRLDSGHTAVQPDERIILFPEADYGDYAEDLKEAELRYNQDHALFLQTDFHDPELIPAAEQLQETLADLLSAAKLIFDAFGNIPGMQDSALEIMNRICKDSFTVGEEVSKHVKTMLEQFPDDGVLHDDLKEIDESFTDFYLDAYGVLVKYRKKEKSN